jgi:allophanate hydrolase
VDKTFRHIAALALPTAPTVYTCSEVEADPITLNSRLGTYTNFVNLLELCGTAVPTALHEDGTPFGISFIAPAGQDALAASLAKALQADCVLPLGAPVKSR